MNREHLTFDSRRKDQISPSSPMRDCSQSPKSRPKQEKRAFQNANFPRQSSFDEERSSSHGISSQQELKDGKWNEEQHRLFIIALKKHGKNWRKMAKIVLSRTSSQIRSHAQKYFSRMEKEKGKDIPEDLLQSRRSLRERSAIRSFHQQNHIDFRTPTTKNQNKPQPKSDPIEKDPQNELSSISQKVKSTKKIQRSPKSPQSPKNRPLSRPAIRQVHIPQTFPQPTNLQPEFPMPYLPPNFNFNVPSNRNLTDREKQLMIYNQGYCLGVMSQKGGQFIMSLPTFQQKVYFQSQSRFPILEESGFDFENMMEGLGNRSDRQAFQPTVIRPETVIEEPMSEADRFSRKGTNERRNNVNRNRPERGRNPNQTFEAIQELANEDEKPSKRFDLRLGK